MITPYVILTTYTADSSNIVWDLSSIECKRKMDAFQYARFFDQN